jgi:hypothetical protein
MRGSVWWGLLAAHVYMWHQQGLVGADMTGTTAASSLCKHEHDLWAATCALEA